MTTVTAAQVKELREATGVGMMECKKALVENGGDMDKALVWLRERGLSRAANKAGRTAAEGLVEFVISDNGKEAAMVEVNCETDFAAKNEDFKSFVAKVATIALSVKSSHIDALAKAGMGEASVSEKLTELIAKVGENMTLRRVAYVGSPNGFVAGYNHMGGKIGALVAFEGDASSKAEELGNDLAMHVAASAPRYFKRDEVDASELEQEKEIARSRLREQGKAEDLIEKVLVGQVNKFYSEICFLDQPFVKEPKMNVSAVVKQSGAKVMPKSIVRFQLGEGIEVKEQNFADEVAAQLRNK